MGQQKIIMGLKQAAKTNGREKELDIWITLGVKSDIIGFAVKD